MRAVLWGWLLLAASAGVAAHDFVTTNLLPDGEREDVYSFGGVVAKETTAVDPRNVSIRLSESVVLRQLSDGHWLLHLIVTGDGALSDCEEEHGAPALRFWEAARDAAPRGSPLARPPAWMDAGLLRRQCRQLHRRAKRLARQQRHNRSRRNILEAFIAPGTKWCGPHMKASKYTDLGPLSNSDRCCRKHDHCAHVIHAFSSDYHFYNMRPFTISHCRCDARFRTCLKLSGTGAANLVGKLFFNVVQTKCFVLKPRKVCVKHSWWGQCQKSAYRKTAHLRNNLPY